MNTQLPTISSQRPRPLKAAPALDTLSSRESFQPMVLVNNSVVKPSPLKALFLVGAQVKDPAAWDSQWFGSYE